MLKSILGSLGHGSKALVKGIWQFGYLGIAWLSKFHIRVIISIIVIFVFMVTGISESIKQKSVVPLALEIGGRVVAADAMVGRSVDEALNPDSKILEPNVISPSDGVFSKIKGYFGNSWSKLFFFVKVFGSFWFIGLFIWFIYKFFDAQLSISPGINFSLAFMVMFFLMIVSSMFLYIWDNQGEKIEDMTFREQLLKFAPFQGTANFVIRLPDLLQNRYKDINKPVEYDGVEHQIINGTLKKPLTV